MKTEKLKEGWVEFTRFYCKEGYLDRWIGDGINDPNNPRKHNMNLNAIAYFWRCNDSKWISNRNICKTLLSTITDIGEDFTAQEIWDNFVNDKKK